MDITFPSLRFDIRIGRLKSIIVPWFVADISHRSRYIFFLAQHTSIPRVRHRSLIFASNNSFFSSSFFNLYHFFTVKRRKNPSNNRSRYIILLTFFLHRERRRFSSRNPIVRYAQWRVFRRVFTTLSEANLSSLDSKRGTIHHHG